MYPRSFRARLTWFFLVIVILPMVMVTLVLFRLVADSEQGKADARLAQAQTSASELYRADEDSAAEGGRRIGESTALSAAIESGDPGQIQAQFAIAAKQAGATYALLQRTDGTRYATGDPKAVAVAGTTLVDRNQNPAGTLTVSIRTPQGFIDEVHTITRLEAAITSNGDTEATTIDGLDAGTLPARGSREIHGTDYHVSSFDGQSGNGTVKIALLGNANATQDATSSNRLVVLL